MKILNLFAMASVLAICLSFSASAFTLHEIKVDILPQILTIPTAEPTETVVGQSHGHGKICKSLWAWNGNEYIKRDVVYRQSTHKGVLIDNIAPGYKCQALNTRPTTNGMMGVSDDITPLPFQWYKK